MTNTKFDLDVMLQSAANAVRESTPALRHVVVVAIEHDHDGIARAAISSAPGGTMEIRDAMVLVRRAERAIKGACPHLEPGW